MDISRRSFLASGLLLVPAAAAWAQRPSFNERQVSPSLNVQDKEDIWTLHFNFKDPRMLQVDVPGRGRKVVWYMWYQVVNRTNTPHTFIPDFELRTRDRQTLHHDEVLPAVQEAIRKIEDPTNRYNIQNSVTISKTPIPVTKPDSMPRAMTGIAIWTDVFDKARDTAHFDVFVSGLSNGWSIDDDGKIRRKTLHLEFKRYGDGSKIDSTEIRWVEPEQWIYRVTSANVDLKLPPSVQPDVKK